MIMKANTSKIIRFITLGAAATFWLVGPAGVFNAAAATNGNRGQLSSQDYKFVTDAAQGGMMEVTLGQLAAQKAADPAVRDFGQRMVQDHQKANEQLMEIVSQKGATLPANAEGKEQGTMEHLKSLSGTDFDKAYIKHMVSDHKKDVKEFEKAAQKSQDPDLKAFANKTLPVLQEHLSMAESVKGKVAGEKSQSKAE